MGSSVLACEVRGSAPLFALEDQPDPASIVHARARIGGTPADGHRLIVIEGGDSTRPLLAKPKFAERREIYRQEVACRGSKSAASLYGRRTPAWSPHLNRPADGAVFKR